MEPQSLKWLYIDFNSYFASVEQQLNPALRGKPVAVIPTETDSTCAIAASYEAKAYGIKTGTFIYEAKKMCPDLICVLADHEKYVIYHHLLIEEIDKYIPISKTRSIDEHACELQGFEQTEKGATQLAEKIKNGISANVGEHIKSSIGISSNSFLAKIASNLKKPDGLTILHPQDAPTRLANLPPRFLQGIGANMEIRLQANGIFKIADLYKLDPKKMRKIWHSVLGEKYWHMLRGVELPEQESIKRNIGHSHVLSPEMRPPDKARNVAKRLCNKASSRLRRLEYFTSEISLSFKTEKGNKASARKRFYRACDSFSIQNNMLELWDYLIANHHPERIKKISITLHSLVKNQDIQNDFFDDMEDKGKIKKYQKISYTIDQLNARFGRDSIVIGDTKQKASQFSGTKIAFQRIPDFEEFHE